MFFEFFKVIFLLILSLCRTLLLFTCEIAAKNLYKMNG